MRFEKCDYSQLKRGYKRTKLYGFILEFKDSGIACAEIKDFSHASATVCAGALNKSIKHFNLAGIEAFSRNGKAYIMNTLLVEKEGGQNNAK